MFIGEWNKSVVLTYVGMAFAVLGIFMASEGKVLQAIACLIVAGICDVFDGTVARLCKRTERQKKFGIQLDSLADVVNFLALPVSICINIGMNKWYHIGILIWFSVCGVARLAFFNVTTEEIEGPVKYYRGLPVTYTALIIPFVYLLKYVLADKIFLIVISFTMVATSILNILDIKVIKPKKGAYALVSVVAAGMLVLYLGVLGNL